MEAKKRLGEFVLRSEKPQALVAFYRDVIGLELFATVGSATFLKVADDLEGHPQLLAVFEKTHAFSGPENLNPSQANAGGGTLHHFAFALEKDYFRSEVERLQGLGAALRHAEHSRFGWRSVYLFDPDGNSVELVCYDPDLFTTQNRQ